MIYPRTCQLCDGETLSWVLRVQCLQVNVGTDSAKLAVPFSSPARDSGSSNLRSYMFGSGFRATSQALNAMGERVLAFCCTPLCCTVLRTYCHRSNTPTPQRCSFKSLVPCTGENAIAACTFPLRQPQQPTDWASWWGGLLPFEVQYFLANRMTFWKEKLLRLAQLCDCPGNFATQSALFAAHFAVIIPIMRIPSGAIILKL